MTSASCTDRVEKSVSQNRGRALSVALKENDMHQADFDAAIQKRYSESMWVADCDRVVRVALDRLGLSVERSEAQMVWREWSETSAAQWLHMDDGEDGDDEIERALWNFVNRE